MTFNVFFMNGCAFIDANDGHLLCIGSVQEVKTADANGLANMVELAFAMHEFKQIEHDIRLTLH